MYESVLHIDAANRVGSGWLSNRYRIHQRLHMAFAQDVEQRLLWALLPEARIAVRHRVEADWRKAFTDLPILLQACVVGADLAPIQGAEYVFSLEACPSKMISRSGKRISLSDAEVPAWIERKLYQAGCTPVAVKSTPVIRIRSKGEHEYIHPSVKFGGKVRVKDADLLRQAYETGIGPAKGFGFGMLHLSVA